jgi:shikimate dehydrogenase
MITGKTQLLGVIGDPISHSLSPVMHNAAIQVMNMTNDQDQVDYVYLPFPIKTENLAGAIACLQNIGVKGFNVTIPHKQTIMPLLTEVSVIAQAVGAVNTVYLTANGWAGTNTDMDGFIAPLKQYDWANKTAIILGNGGSSRAVVAGCHQLGMKEIHVLGRNQTKLQEFLDSWQNSPLPVNLQVHDWQEIDHLISDCALLVNTTPLGMYPNVHESPLSQQVVNKLTPNTIVYDLIYTPNPTKFLAEAQQQGTIIIDGLEMLVQQGAIALQLWLKRPVPVDIMRQSLQKHLGLI